MKQNLNRSNMDGQLQDNEDNDRCCSCHVICQEMSCSKRIFEHEPITDFFKCQWQKGERSVVFLIYRWLFASWFTTCMAVSLKDLFISGKWFIYFTNWGYSLATLMSIYSALLVSFFFCNLHMKCIPNWALKIYWSMHFTSFVCATGITLIYWGCIFPFSSFSIPEGTNNPEIIKMYSYFFNDKNDRSYLLYFHNVAAHALNSVLMVLDQMLVAFPTHLLHFIYPTAFALIYACFTIVYYFAGGVNVVGLPYIYAMLNWDQYPLTAIINVFWCTAVIIPMTFLAFMLYRIRICLYNRKRRREAASAAEAPMA